MSLMLKAHESVRVKISSVGTYVPPRLLTNADLEKMVATNDQWITERTGIRERHIAEKGVASSDLGAEAARRCLAARGTDATEVEAIVVATAVPMKAPPRLVTAASMTAWRGDNTLVATTVAMELAVS